jgi:hypothetical protein
MTESYTVNIESAPLAGKVTPDALDAYASALFADRRIAGPAPSANLALNTVGLTTSIDARSPDHAFRTTKASFLEAAKIAGLGKPMIVILDVELDRVDRVDRHELVSGGEVARRLKISRERVRQLSENPARFPPPLATIGRDRVWRWVDVVDWAAARGRRLAVRKKSRAAFTKLKAAKKATGRRSR